MKCILISLFLLPLFSPAQELSATELQANRQIIKTALTDKTNKQIGVDKVISDNQTAIAVAEAILFKIYGKDQIIEERPYQVHLVDGYWVLLGSLPRKYEVGGTFLIILSAKDGKVIKLTHGK